MSMPLQRAEPEHDSSQIPSAKSPVAARRIGNAAALLLLFPEETPSSPPQQGDLPVNSLVIVVSIEELYFLEGL